MEFIPLSTAYLTEGCQLYESAFPEIERRPTEQWTELISREPSFHAEAIVENNEFCGFITSWHLDNFVYVEHFAIAPEKRCGGYGGRSLQHFLEKEAGKNVVLEVELPENELAVRRIKFYERNGLHLIEREYLQPPYQKGFDFLPLYLMSTCPQQTLDNFKAIESKIHQVVYGVKS